MNIQEIGYFLYMQQEEEQKRHIKVNVNENVYLAEDQSPIDEEQKSKK